MTKFSDAYGNVVTINRQTVTVYMADGTTRHYTLNELERARREYDIDASFFPVAHAPGVSAWGRFGHKMEG